MRRLALVLIAALSGAGQAGTLVPGAPNHILQVFDDRGIYNGTDAFEMERLVEDITTLDRER